jgi:hypothetical protein
MQTDITRLSGANGEALADDLLVGAKAISKYLYGDVEGLKETNIRRVYHAISKREIPVFYIGGKMHARKSTIRKHIEAQEQAV